MPFDKTKTIELVEDRKPTASLVEISQPETIRETPPLAPFPGDRFSDAAAAYWLEKFPPRPHPLYSTGEVHCPEHYESPSGKASKWAADSMIFQLHFLGVDEFWLLVGSGRAFYDLQKAALVTRDKNETFLFSIFELRKKLDAKIVELGIDGDLLDAWTHMPHSSEEYSSLDTLEQKIRRFHKIPGGIQ